METIQIRDPRSEINIPDPQHCAPPVWRVRIRDPVPFLPLDPGWVKNDYPDPGWTIRIMFPRALKQFLGLKYLNSLNVDPGTGMETIRIQDGKNLNLGSGIKIPVPQHCSPERKGGGVGSVAKGAGNCVSPIWLGKGWWLQCLTCYEGSIRS